jgi:large subunit GTPase 1
VVLDSAGTEYRPSSDGQQISKVQWSDQNDEGEAEVARRRHRQNHFAFHDLSVPRRPEWNKNTTPDELDRLEKESFLNWRRSIAEKEEELQRHIFASGTTPTAATASVTPFEKNIQVWKQLWRVLERSSCVIQVVDARNPLFYLSTDLRTYAEKELGKPMMLIINKSDFLTKKQRQVWHTYFKSRGWEHLFFSAVQEQKKLDEQATAERHLAQEVDERLADDNDNNDDDDDGESEDAKEDLEKDVADPAVQDAIEEHLESDNVGVDSLLTQQELIEKLDDFGHRHGCEPDERYDNRVQFGMVGFPNVGKVCLFAP